MACLATAPAFAWEQLCTLEGPGLSGKISFLVYSIYRQKRNNGNWDYRISIPLSVGNRCGVGQYAEAKVSATFYMTKNLVFESGEFKRYKGSHTLETTIEDQRYAECIGADYSTSYKCKY